MHLTASMPHLVAQGWRVAVDGRDVTDDCYEADDEAGYALVYERGKDRHFTVRDGRPLTKRLTGVVTITRPTPE